MLLHNRERGGRPRDNLQLHGEPLFHISDDNNGTRLFKLYKIICDTREMETRESEMYSLLSAAEDRYYGNFIYGLPR